MFDEKELVVISSEQKGSIDSSGKKIAWV